MRILPIASLLLAITSTVACSDDEGVDSDEEARRAYLGLDQSLGKSLTLGFDGFNAATSANIPPQMGTGILGGTITISGKVDQGSSDNKNMTLNVGMVDYTDGHIMLDGEEADIDITYDTSADLLMQPIVDLQLKNFPNGTLEGTLIGSYQMDGDLIGEATVNLMFVGTTQDSAGLVIRVPGTTHVTGTVTSASGGTFNVDIML